MGEGSVGSGPASKQSNEVGVGVSSAFRRASNQRRGDSAKEEEGGGGGDVSVYGTVL